MTRISVAMATYNGEKYLEEQLRSLLAQDLAPCELVVGDDGSTDRTLEILEEFAASAPFPVTVQRNAQNLGYGENFLQTAARCSGDWIAFCDQDDVWFPAKLSQCAEAIAKHPGVNMVLQNAELCDADLKPTGRLYPAPEKAGLHGPNQQHGFWVWPGFVKTIRAELIRAIPFHNRPLDFGRTGKLQTHDKWTCMIANSIGGICVLGNAAAYYRRHGGALSGSYDSRNFRQTVHDAKSVGADQYRLNAKVASQYAEYYACLAGEVEHGGWGRLFSVGENKYRSLSRIYDLRAGLYGATGGIDRARVYGQLWLSGGYLGDPFLAMGIKSAAKDLFVALRGGGR